MYPLGSPKHPLLAGKDSHMQRCLAAFSAIEAYFFPSSDRTFARHTAAEGLFQTVRWMCEANDDKTRAARVEHMLAARPAGQQLRFINWDWAYSFRKFIRESALVMARLAHESEQYTLIDLSDERWEVEGGWQEMLGMWADSDGGWYLCVEQIEAEDAATRSIVLRNVVAAVTALAQKRSSSSSAGASADKVCLSPATLLFLYARDIRSALQHPDMHVGRCEISGKHGLTDQLLSDICEARDAEPGSTQHMKLRFLHALPSELLSEEYKGTALPQKVMINQALRKQHSIGTDFCGPEADFNAGGCRTVLSLLHSQLGGSVQAGTWKVYKSGEKAVIRIHVGESDMYGMSHDPVMALRGRTNVEIILRVLESLEKLFQVHEERITVRLGHLTAITLDQAYRLRSLPFDVSVELNAYSNISTNAAPNQGSLPVLKVYVADALYRSDSPRGKASALAFTCNTDGGGVMGTSIRKEITLAMQLIHCFTAGTPLPLGGDFDGSQPSIAVYPGDLRRLRGKVTADAWARFEASADSNTEALSGEGRARLQHSDLLPEVQQLLKSNTEFLRAAFPVA